MWSGLSDPELISAGGLPTTRLTAHFSTKWNFISLTTSCFYFLYLFPNTKVYFNLNNVGNNNFLSVQFFHVPAPNFGLISIMLALNLKYNSLWKKARYFHLPWISDLFLKKNQRIYLLCVMLHKPPKYSKNYWSRVKLKSLVNLNLF